MVSQVLMLAAGRRHEAIVAAALAEARAEWPAAAGGRLLASASAGGRDHSPRPLRGRRQSSLSRRRRLLGGQL